MSCTLSLEMHNTIEGLFAVYYLLHTVDGPAGILLPGNEKQYVLSC